MRNYGQLDFNVIEELYRLIQERIYLFVDNARDNISELEYFIEKSRKARLPITIISAERINEWNIGCERLDRFVSNIYILKYLSRKEIEKLISLLKENNSLGHLKGLSEEEQIKSFEKRAGRQLLVALHEATLGRPYEDIIVDEYNEIRPQKAQLIYLSVCFLNRLNILVRSGLISRLYGIPFEEFRNNFFKPLEHVVQVIDKDKMKDYHYAARHTQIAEIVFSRILTSPDDRFNEYVRILNVLNLSFDSDREAFRELIKGRVLIDLFNDYHSVIQIFKVAESIAFDDPYLYHQMGIYEMQRPNGNLDNAQKHLLKARELDERDSTIIHSMAELYRIKAENSKHSYEKERYRAEAKKLSSSLLRDSYTKKYAIHTLIKIYMDELKDLLDKGDTTDREIDNTVKNIESYFEIGLQEFPADSYLLSTESDFHRILENESKAFTALEKAFKVNKRDPYISIRLSKFYLKQGDNQSAINVMREALEANPGEKKLHFNLAQLLMGSVDQNIDEILYHLKKSFSKWDHNIDAQFWYGVYCFMAGEEEKLQECREIFKRFRDVPMSYEYRIGIREKFVRDGKIIRFSGTINKKESTYGFISRDGFGDHIFLHMNNVSKELWNSIMIGDRVSFAIGFNFQGPTAIDIRRS